MIVSTLRGSEQIGDVDGDGALDLFVTETAFFVDASSGDFLVDPDTGFAFEPIVYTTILGGAAFPQRRVLIDLAPPQGAAVEVFQNFAPPFIVAFDAVRGSDAPLAGAPGASQGAVGLFDGPAFIDADIDGDGYADRVTLAMVDYDSETGLPGGDDPHAVIVYGGPDGVPDLALSAIDGSNGFILTGWSNAIAGSGFPSLRYVNVIDDITGDGLPDIIAVESAQSGGEFERDVYASAVISADRDALALLDRLDGAADGRVSYVATTAVLGGDGADRLVTERGDRFAVGGGGADVIDGRVGSEFGEARAGFPVVLDGGDGDDRIIGSAFREWLIGGDGDDVLRSGDDDDRISCGAGDDVALAGDGDDTVFGQSGADTVKAGLGDDLIDGGDGDDVLFAWRGDDSIDGGAGDDFIRGGIGDDLIEGGAGNDRIVAGPGRDVLVFREGFGSDRVIDFRVGSDLLDFSLHAGVGGFGDLSIRLVGRRAVIEDGDGGRIVLDGSGLDLLDETAFVF
ncbi:calcium-binding protein [Rubrimonas cliftonensis]|uniref:Hemolysin-type calcium-binding repeat-containing protein n=1 Tax=Rubrimonas cliftonensis TaxID=89524 RepID=A0A1H3VRI3_9RHOB|nr:calcium-binding protein [Rubrimonas cliftonensis]SDZ77423.1 Hemolysin-type calcium-binding repeat-containing protein [Rubrimonas cliftonensis]